MGQTNFQDYKLFPVRAASILTGSFVAGTVIDSSAQAELKNQGNLYVNLTLGNLTSALLKFEFSNDGTTYYQETFGNISGATETDTLGEHALAASGHYRIPIQIKDKFIKISAKGGSIDPIGSSLTLDFILGTA